MAPRDLFSTAVAGGYWQATLQVHDVDHDGTPDLLIQRQTDAHPQLEIYLGGETLGPRFAAMQPDYTLPGTDDSSYDSFDVGEAAGHQARTPAARSG